MQDDSKRNTGPKSIHNPLHFDQKPVLRVDGSHQFIIRPVLSGNEPLYGRPIGIARESDKAPRFEEDDCPYNQDDEIEAENGRIVSCDTKLRGYLDYLKKHGRRCDDYEEDQMEDYEEYDDLDEDYYEMFGYEDPEYIRMYREMYDDGIEHPDEEDDWEPGDFESDRVF